MSTAPAPTPPGAIVTVPQTPPGFFDYSDLYNRMVDTAPRDSWLVEIGVYHGLSLRHLAHAAKAADKNLTVVGIDWGRGSSEHAKQMEQLPFNNLAGPMLHTLVNAGVADDCTLILGPSTRVAKFIPDGACHMVFIDGDHSHNGCLADIRAYLPKIAKGGSLVGHDYFTFAGVRTAVHAAFGHKDHMCRDCESCWEVRL